MKKYIESEKWFKRALNCLVGGVNSPVRSFQNVESPYPLLAQRGDRAWIWDLDGHQYIDFIMGYGPHLFGHAHPYIIETIKSHLSRSNLLGLTSKEEILWSERILERIPFTERIRAMNSGTEACTTAIRLARSYTQRKLILKFSGSYHGHNEELLLSENPSDSEASLSKTLPLLFPSKAVQTLPFNNINLLEDFFKKNGSQLAAVIMEPIMGNIGVIPPRLEFLKKIKNYCLKYKALLIFDEVMTGLRVHKNSSQALFEIEADLVCLGKIIGGGSPLSGLAGKKKIMDQLAPSGPVYQAGTFSGNPISIISGLAMLDLIDKENPYPILETLGKKIENIFIQSAQKTNTPLRVQRMGSMLGLFFTKNPVLNAKEARSCDLNAFRKLFWALLEEGILIPPSPFESLFLSLAHHENIDLKNLEIQIEKAFEKAFLSKEKIFFE